MVPGRITELWNSGWLCSSRPCVLIVFHNPFKHRSSCPSNVYLTTLAGNLVDYPHLVFLDRHRVVSDVRRVCMPCCCRQRRRVSDSPFTYDSTTVDLISGAGSFGDIRFFVLVTFFTKETDNRSKHWLTRGIIHIAFPDLSCTRRGCKSLFLKILHVKVSFHR